MAKKRTRPRGVALVAEVLAHVSSGDAAFQIHKPRPLSAAVIAKLAGQKNPIPPSLAAWLAFDAAWLTREVGWFVDGKSLERATLSSLAGKLGPKDFVSSFKALEPTIKGKGAILDHGSESARFLYFGVVDTAGELPVLYLDVEDSPLLGLQLPGFDVWLAVRAGLYSLEDAVAIYADAMTEHRAKNLHGFDCFEQGGAWSGCVAPSASTRAEAPKKAAAPKPKKTKTKAPTAEQEAEELRATFCEAASAGDAETVDKLLPMLALDSATSGLDDALILAIREKEPAMAIRLLEAGANPNSSATRYWSLGSAANHGQIDVLEAMLQKGADPNHRRRGADGAFESTALKDAAGTNAARSIEVLLAHGADPNLSDPLDEAARTGHVASLEALLRGGADPRKSPNALIRAVEKIDLRAVELLLQHGADPSARDWRGNTPLHITFMHRKNAMTAMLLAQNAPLDQKNDAGWSVGELLDARGRPRRTISASFRAGPEPRELTIEARVLSWDRPKDMSRQLRDMGRTIVDLVASGAAGSDVFPPATGVAELLQEPTPEAMDPANVRLTLRWQLCVAGVAPIFLATVARLFFASIPSHHTTSLSIIGNPTEEGEKSVDSRQLEEWAFDPKANPEPFRPLSFEVHPRIGKMTSYRVRFAKPVDLEVQRIMKTLGYRLESLLPSFPNRDGAYESKGIYSVDYRDVTSADELAWDIRTPPGALFAADAPLAAICNLLETVAHRGTAITDLFYTYPG